MTASVSGILLRIATRDARGQGTFPAWVLRWMMAMILHTTVPTGGGGGTKSTVTTGTPSRSASCSSRGSRSPSPRPQQASQPPAVAGSAAAAPVPIGRHKCLPDIRWLFSFLVSAQQYVCRTQWEGAWLHPFSSQSLYWGHGINQVPWSSFGNLRDKIQFIGHTLSIHPISGLGPKWLHPLLPWGNYIY